MKYIQEFRDGALAKNIAQRIQKVVEPQRHYKLMEFCGGHTHAIHHYGITSLLPSNVEMIHGPGCPVCVLPIARIDHAIQIAENPQVIFCSYGDMLRIPGSKGKSLFSSRANTADVRMVYSVDDALAIAEQNPSKEVVFFAIGFETTTPPTAVAIQKAHNKGLTNFSVFCNHVLTPPALDSLLAEQQHDPDISELDGFVGPGHVSIVVGSQAYQPIVEKYQKPIVISGFEPLDILYSILLLIQLVNQNRADIEIQYTRGVNPQGNQKSQALMQQILELRDTFEWRGLGWIPHSALQIKKAYRDFDAEYRFGKPGQVEEISNGCQCGAILRGIMKPSECEFFAKSCTPENPMGACMVSSEGACAAHYGYARFAHERTERTVQ